MTTDGPIEFKLKPDLNTSLTNLEKEKLISKGKL